MPKFYCDYCDTYLTHDSPSVRKTHCSGRKHKENVKDYYQKWMEEQAQSLIDKTTAAFQQGKIPPTPFPGGPPPVRCRRIDCTLTLGAYYTGGPPRPGMLPTPPMGGPPMMPMMGPPPHGMMPGGPAVVINHHLKLRIPFAVTFRRHEAADGRTHADDARTTTHDASPSTDDDASQAGHDATRQIRASGFSPFFVAATNRHCLLVQNAAARLLTEMSVVPFCQSICPHGGIEKPIICYYLIRACNAV
uniref:U1 small nuclear ribonucleoprotein C n=1 Tax=Dicentrarchus labrax TaxID=13489 RepID=E6ZEW7_DICLA|nr:U1 small nuclear ribonucleoprotein C [Dicentrarchus labrax]